MLSVLAALVAAAVLALGCGRGGGERDSGQAGLGDVSPAVRQAWALQQELLAESAPAAPFEATVRSFHDFSDALNDPDRRIVLTDSFFAVWEREPDQALWAELAVIRGYLLQQRARRDAMLDAAAGTDTAAALHWFVQGRRIWARDPAVAAEALRRAAALDRGGDPLFTIWSQLRLGFIECETGNLDLGTERIAGLVPRAWSVGGATLAGTCWQELSYLARRGGHLGDALVAARAALACARRAESTFLESRALLALGQVHLERREYAAADSFLAACVTSARDGSHVRQERSAIGVRSMLARAIGDIDLEIEVIEAGAVLAEAAADTNAMVHFGAALGNALQRRGDLDAAMVRLDQTLAVNSQWSHGDYGSVIRKEQGVLLNQLGRYAGSRVVVVP